MGERHGALRGGGGMGLVWRLAIRRDRRRQRQQLRGFALRHCGEAQPAMGEFEPRNLPIALRELCDESGAIDPATLMNGAVECCLALDAVVALLAIYWAWRYPDHEEWGDFP